MSTATPTDSAERLSAMLDDLDAIVWEADGETGRFSIVRGRLLTTLGFAAERWIADAGYWPNRIHPDDRAAYRQERAAAVAAKRSTALEYRVVTPNRRVVWVRDCIRIGAVDERTVVRGVIVDVTSHHWTAEALREAKDRYKELVEEINEVVFTIDEEGLITYVSPAIERVSGYKPSEVVGRAFTDFIEPEDLNHMLESFQRSVGGNTESVQYRLRIKDGSFRWFLSNSRPIHDGDGFITGIRGVLTDITEMKNRI